MNIIFGFVGILLAQLPLIIAIVLCFIFPPFNFWKFYIFYFLFEAINDGISKQTAVYIARYKPYTTQRSITEMNIVNGTAKLSERSFLAMFRTLENIVDWKHYISCAIMSAVVTLVYNWLR